MFMGWRGRQSGGAAAGISRAAVAITGLCLVPMLAGCIFNERSLLGIEIPDRYQTRHSLPPTPPPALDWWRGFRSNELTALIEEAQTANFDVAAAVAKIIQADAQSKIAGAPLLPGADLDASVTRSRPAGGPDRTTWRTAITASYEIDFWGKNRAASRAAQESAIAARFDRDTVVISTVVSVATAYFLVLASQDRLRIANQNVEAASRVLTLDPAAPGGRHRLGARSRAAGNAGGEPARAGSGARRGAAAEQGDARAADRQAAGIRADARRQPLFARHSAGEPGPAVRAALPAPRHPLGRGDGRLHRRQRRVGPRGVLPEHPADRARRLHQHGAAHPVPAGVGVLFARRRADAADLRRLAAGGPAGAGAGPAARVARASTARPWCRASPTSSGR